MRARVTFAPDSLGAELRFATRNADGTSTAWVLEDGHWRMQRVDEGATVPVALTLPDELWFALRDEIAFSSDAARAVRDHRDDAVGVRDRLLDLLDRSWA